MATDNSTILAHAWLSGTNDFQQRIPDPTQSGIDSTIDALLDPMNKVYFNQFIDILIMRIGDTFVHQQTFRNPLAVFKKSKMMYGATMQEIVPKWIRAHAYVDDAEDVFKMARPDVAQWFHSQNRRDRYDITINRDELRTAFTEEGGLNRLVAAILDVPMNSDEYDEYRIMLQLIAQYDHKWGFFKQQIDDIYDEHTAKAFLKQLRTYAGRLQFPNTIYNNGAVPDVPIFVRPSELVLLITPDVQASIDVDALAVLFHLEKAEVQQRTIVVDEFPIPYAKALLTTQDFFVCRDTEYTTTSAYNPKTLGTNYFLHHWGIYSVSPFVPAILFTTESGTEPKTIKQYVSGFSLSVDTTNDYAPYVGGSVRLVPELSGSLELMPDETTYTGDDVAIAPAKAALYNVGVTGTRDAVMGEYTITVGGTWAADDTITIDGYSYTVVSGSTSTSAIATALQHLLANNSNYSLARLDSTLTFYEIRYGIGAPEFSKTSTSGTLTEDTVTQGSSGIVAITSPSTYVDGSNVLHLGNDLSIGDVVTVNAATTYVNPSGNTDAYTDSVEVTVLDPNA